MSYITAALLAAALVHAAWGDLRTRTIPNWLNLAVAAGAPLWVLFATAFEPRIRAAAVTGSLVSYSSIAESEFYTHRFGSFGPAVRPGAPMPPPVPHAAVIARAPKTVVACSVVARPADARPDRFMVVSSFPLKLRRTSRRYKGSSRRARESADHPQPRARRAERGAAMTKGPRCGPFVLSSAGPQAICSINTWKPRLSPCRITISLQASFPISRAFPSSKGQARIGPAHPKSYLGN